jgi:lipopolysaccharide/colanic/teichoic acid biosynthesis glycosyltransferase
MSVVGPRPHDVQENIKIKDQIKLYMFRHIVKPGITGWAQVKGYRGGTNDMNLMQKRIEHDIWYIENWYFGLDIQIIILTLWDMIKGAKNAY